MPELTPTGAVDVVVRQVRRVRRRKNFYELQRVLFLTIAAGAAAAALLLPVALFAPARSFALAAWGGALALGGVALVLVGRARRRWLVREVAVRWIDEHGALAGRLRTLTELVHEGERPARMERPATRFFLPLLAAEVERDLDRWAPRRLVPRGVPRAAAAGAALACLGLALVLRLAATATPTLPQLIFGDTPRAGTEIATPGDAVSAGQVLVAPPATGDGENPDGPSGSGAAREPSTFASLPSELQERVRKHVWGEAWERVRETLARAGEHGGGGGSAMAPGDDAEYGEPAPEEGDEWEIARAPSGGLTRRRRPASGDRSPGRDDGSKTAAHDTAVAPNDANDPSDASADGGATAGNGVGPPLYGRPDVDSREGAGSFELSLAARMRALRGGDRPPGGPAPPPALDARPELANDQRRESAAHRMAVPAAYEPVVREVFAHRRPAPDQP